MSQSARETQQLTGELAARTCNQYAHVRKPPSRFNSDLAEIVAVTAVWQIGRKPAQCLVVDIGHTKGNFFGAADFQALSLLDRLYEKTRLQE